MDREKKRRYQNYKVIFSEIIMTLAVIVTVVVLAFIVSGYWLNSDFKVERQGLLQISSVPTGAEVIIDNESAWLQRTNTSKVLSNGEHKVELKKEGYDSWSKDIIVSEGFLYRIHYPRLFLLQREKEKVLDIDNISFASVSPNRENMLMTNNTTEWLLLDIDREKVEKIKIDVSELFSGVSLANDAKVGLFNSEILSADWAKDNNHLLFKVKNSESIEWVILDVRNPKNSINLTKEFGADFKDVKILDNSASSLLVLGGDNLHKIDVSSRTVSAVILEHVVNFDHFENEIAYVNKNDNKYVLGTIRIGDDNPTILDESMDLTKVLISKFYEDKYITLLRSNIVTLYKEEDFSEIKSFTLNFTPKEMEVGHNGEFITFADGGEVATLDMEALEITEWSLGGANYGWVDSDMIYAIDNGDLFVYDFDGLNRRRLASNISGHYPVTITSDKWLYYFSDGALMREWLIKR